VDFPLQMVVHSRRFDISGYITIIETAAAQLTNDLLKVQAEEYSRFIRELSELANIMSKSFFIVLPFSAALAGVKSKGVFGGFRDLFAKKPDQAAGFTPEQLAAYRDQLSQRADLVLGGLSGMGLRGHLLTQEELIKVFKDLYNPAVPPSKKPAA